MKRILLATLLAASGSVTAAPFYVDVGFDYNSIGTVEDKVCDTCTSLKNQFGFTYNSTSIVTDNDGTAGISTGDSISTNAGYDGSTGTFFSGALGNNWIHSYNPGETLGDSDNGYGSAGDWFITFGIKDWTGTVTVDGGGNVFPTYGSGLLEFYVSTDNGSTFDNFMDINLSTGYVTGTGSLIAGEVDFTNVDGVLNNLFNVGTAQCGGLNGFYDIWAACGPTGIDSLSIDLTAHFDSDVDLTSFATTDGIHFTVTTDHDGSGRFDVPEPGTLSLLGLSLLGLGGFRMRKAADKKIAA